MEDLEWGKSQGEFAKQLCISEKLVNAESRRKKLGKAQIYDGIVVPTNPNSNRIPDARANHGKLKGKGKPKGKSNFRTGKWANWAEEVGGDNEGNYHMDQGEEEERGDQK